MSAVKRYTSADVEYAEALDWVELKDYLALQAALREALDGWRRVIVGYSSGEIEEMIMDIENPNFMSDMGKRIAELRKFLDDK